MSTALSPAPQAPGGSVRMPRPSRLPTVVRHHLAALRALVVFTLLLGVGYPLVMTGIGQAFFSRQANGSVITWNGRPVGSSLIGQSYTDARGNPLPQWFQPRPSAAVADPANPDDPGYDAGGSAASNLGPSNPDLIRTIDQRRAAVAAFNGVRPDQVPADAVTASASGLDPDISPAYADIQVNRVAHARGLSPATVQALVDRYTEGRNLGILGEPVVNVLALNLALARLDPAQR